MTGFKFHIIDGALIIGAIAAIIFSAFASFAGECEQLPREILRLHILANSDSEEDQRLKYALRDHMLVRFAEVFSECENFEQSVEAAEKHRTAMQEEAQSYIYSMGYDYTVACEVGESYFTTRNYGSFTVPAGDYTAVKFIIGEGGGQNWWCVMFPPLCIPAAGEFFTEEQSREIESGKNVEVKFAVFELFRGLFTDEEEQDEKNHKDSLLLTAVQGLQTFIGKD